MSGAPRCATQGIYAPEMLLGITTPRVLIMEWIEGRRLRRAGKNGYGPSQAELQDDLKLVEIGVQCSLEQVCARPLHMPSAWDFHGIAAHKTDAGGDRCVPSWVTQEEADSDPLQHALQAVDCPLCIS